MNREELNELAKKIYKINVANGFYEDSDKRYFLEHQLLQIQSEVGELNECAKKNKFTDLPIEDFQNENNFKVSLFKSNIKDTFEDELADIVIRLLDLAVYRDVEIKINYNKVENKPDLTLSKYHLSERLFVLNENITDIIYGPNIYLDNCLSICFYIANIYGVDLKEHIHAKLIYNSTRGYKHGKKY